MMRSYLLAGMVIAIGVMTSVAGSGVARASDQGLRPFANHIDSYVSPGAGPIRSHGAVERHHRPPCHEPGRKINHVAVLCCTNPAKARTTVTKVRPIWDDPLLGAKWSTAFLKSSSPDQRHRLLGGGTPFSALYCRTIRLLI
ncbi:MAG: hypothetical protein V3V97_03700 [Hyphomicrobiaceae bacterium]